MSHSMDRGGHRHVRGATQGPEAAVWGLEAEDTEGFSFFSYDLNVLASAWLDGSAPRPSIEYLASIPISFPLIGLTQLTQYLVLTCIVSLTQAKWGATAHSQGI